MHILLNCSLIMNVSDKLLEDLLDILYVFENVSFDLQDTEIQYLALLGALQIPVLFKLHLKSGKKL